MCTFVWEGEGGKWGRRRKILCTSLYSRICANAATLSLPPQRSQGMRNSLSLSLSHTHRHRRSALKTVLLRYGNSRDEICDIYFFGEKASVGASAVARAPLSTHAAGDDSTTTRKPFDIKTERHLLLIPLPPTPLCFTLLLSPPAILLFNESLVTDKGLPCGVSLSLLGKFSTPPS